MCDTCILSMFENHMANRENHGLPVLVKKVNSRTTPFTMDELNAPGVRPPIVCFYDRESVCESVLSMFEN